MSRAELVAALRARQLTILTGLLAALPVIASTIRGVDAGWVPVGDDAIIGVRAFDVFSTHPPLLGQYSASSQVIGEPVQSPGPMLYWLLALPVRIGGVAPAIVVGLVNTATVIGIAALARRRGGLPLMFATAAAVAVMCSSLEAAIFHDVWNPAAALLPFTLLIYLAWSLACGDYRLLPITAVVASFVAQTHLTYAVPAIVLLGIAVAFFVAARAQVPRRTLIITLVLLGICWSFPIVEQLIHRPGNVERIVEAATADKPTLGNLAARRAVVQTAGFDPWWLRPPRPELGRVADVNYPPPRHRTLTGIALLVLLVALIPLALKRRRRDVAAALCLCVGLCASVALVTASTPTSGILFATIEYTLWWTSPAGMFIWITVAWALLALGVSWWLSRRAPRLRPGRLEPRAFGRALTFVGLAAVAVVGTVVAANGDNNRIERTYDPVKTIAARVLEVVPREDTVLVQGTETGTSSDLQGGLVFALRADGRPFVSSALPGLGSRYDPARVRHDSVVRIREPDDPPRSGEQVVTRVNVENLPADDPPNMGGTRTITVTFAR